MFENWFAGIGLLQITAVPAKSRLFPGQITAAIFLIVRFFFFSFVFGSGPEFQTKFPSDTDFPLVGPEILFPAAPPATPTQDYTIWLEPRFALPHNPSSTKICQPQPPSHVWNRFLLQSPVEGTCSTNKGRQSEVMATPSFARQRFRVSRTINLARGYSSNAGFKQGWVSLESD